MNEPADHYDDSRGNIPCYSFWSRIRIVVETLSNSESIECRTFVCGEGTQNTEACREPTGTPQLKLIVVLHKGCEVRD